MSPPCTLYLTLAEPARFADMVRAAFPDWTLEESATAVTLRKRKLFSKREIVFNLSSLEADGDDFTEKLRGMHGFFAKVETGREDIKNMVLAQIRMFTFSAGVVSNKNLDRQAFIGLLDIVKEGHGLMFLPPANLYNGDGDLVFNLDGASDVEAHTVTAPAILLDAQTPVTGSGEARKIRTNELLAFQGVPLCAGLPPLPGDEDLAPRTREEVIARTLGLLMISVYAEMVNTRGLEQAREFIGPILDQYNARPFLSPEEQAFFEDPEPDEDDVQDHVWRYECAWTGLWALGFTNSLPFPDAICDVRGMAALVRECGDLETFSAKAALRPTVALLDEADKAYRYDWACVDALVNGRDAPANLMPGVVRERHRMFNWLIRYQDADWDAVRTDT